MPRSMSLTTPTPPAKRPRTPTALVQHRPLKWTEPQLQAITLLVAGRLSRAKVAQKCGVPVRTLETWVAHPDWQDKFAAMRADIEAAVKDVLYADKTRRVIALSEMAEAAREQYEARPWLKEERQIGRDTETGEPLVMTNENFNRDAHAAFRDALNDIAKELGQRTAKVDVTSKGQQVAGLLPEAAVALLANASALEHAHALLAHLGTGRIVDASVDAHASSITSAPPTALQFSGDDT